MKKTNITKTNFVKEKLFVKIFISVILSVLMVFALSFTAFAEETEAQPEVPAEAEVITEGTTDPVVPDTPRIKKVTSGKGWIKVKIKKAKNADYYTIFMSKEKDGKYKYKGKTENKTFRTDSLKNEKQKYYIKVRAVKNENGKKRCSGFSKPKKANTFQYRKTVASSEMFSKKAFASKKIADIKKGKSVRVIKKYKHWYKIRYKGKVGYVYNKTFDNITNQKKSSVTEKNYKVFLDDWIFENGRGIRNAYDYVSNTHRYTGIAKFHKYRSAKAMDKNQDEMAVHALTHVYTSCKGYNSLLKAILERQGHECYFVFAHHNKYNGVHVWCVVKTKDGYRHIDSRRRFYLIKDSELATNPHSYDLKRLENSYPPCV